MEYVQSKAPYLRNRKTTLQIMVELAIAIAVIWVLAVITTFMKLGTSYGVRSILLMVVSLAVTLACDALVTVLRNKKDKELGKKIVHDLVHNYSWITAAIFTLCCPVWTSYYAIIMGSIFATVIGKLVFGGFGKNIFNPAIVGRIFVALCFDLSVPSALVEKITAEGSTITGFDAATGATVANNFNSTQAWLGSNALSSFKPLDLLTGTYFGAMGETFTIALVVIGIILAIRQVINWRTPVFYLGTVAVSALVIALVLGFNNPGLYVLYHLSVGGLMFGAVFMITDPVTTPTSPFGNCLAGILAGLLTVLIRVGTKSAEGVMYSIAIVNLASPMIDGLITGKTSDKNGLKCGITFGSVALSVLITVGVAWNANGGREVYSINGIDIDKYNALAEKLNFDFVSENNYTYAKYSKDLTALSDEQRAYLKADEENGYDEAYAIVDKDKKEVAVVYCVATQGKTIEIMTEPPYSQKKSATVYVAFSIDTKQVMGVSFATTPYVGQFQSKVENGFADYDYATNNVLTDDPKNIVTGATYSATGVQTLLNSAYDIFVSQYGA